MEVISCANEGVLAVGKVFSNYNEFHGQKKDIWATFNEDGTFEIAGSEENLQGKYNKDEKLRTTDTMAITMNFDNGTKAMGVFGIQQYQDGKKVNSLIFTLDEKIYSFIKLEDN